MHTLPPDQSQVSGPAPVALPILVVGAPRSGTTLIGNYIGSTQAVANLGEYGGLYFSLHVAEREFERTPSLVKERFLAGLWDYSIELAKTTATTAGASAFCDSTPWNLLVWRQIQERVPETVFVLVLRHYAGVIQSLARSRRDGYEWAGPNARSRAKLWARFYEKGLLLSDANTIPVCYDALCKSPAQTLGRLREGLSSRGLFVADAALDVLSVSHATAPEDRRRTLAIRDRRRNLCLRPIPSFARESWTPELEELVRPHVEPVHTQLLERFPGEYQALT